MILLKLGGSAITDKSKKFSVRKKVLNRIASQIKAANERLIIVHGGGSFGHPVAARYKLQEGFKNKEQIAGVALTRKSMAELNKQVVSSLLRQDIPAVSIQPSANIICKNKRISQINIEIIKRFIELGNVPVLYGDVVLDETQGFCILSGDQIISHLSKTFNPSKIILATDVDGVFDKNPKKFRSAELIEEINPVNLEKVLQKLEALPSDVTGGIKGKLLELVALARMGFEAQIINALKPGRLKKALLGEQVTGTTIKKGKYSVKTEEKTREASFRRGIQNDRYQKA